MKSKSRGVLDTPLCAGDDDRAKRSVPTIRLFEN
jgi:hypothetical protein